MADDEIILTEAGSFRKRLRLSLSVYKQQSLLNIRYYYEDKKSGEMRATPKGISVTRNNFLVIADTLAENNEAISSFMENGCIDDSLTTWEQNKSKALEAVGAVEEIVSEIKPIPGRDFTEVSYEGSKAIVSLNSNHKHVEHLKSDRERIKVLEGIAVALDLSHKMISEDESNEVQHALERFRSEFSRQLKNLPK